MSKFLAFVPHFPPATRHCVVTQHAPENENVKIFAWLYMPCISEVGRSSAFGFHRVKKNRQNVLLYTVSVSANACGILLK